MHPLPDLAGKLGERRRWLTGRKGGPHVLDERNCLRAGDFGSRVEFSRSIDRRSKQTA